MVIFGGFLGYSGFMRIFLGIFGIFSGFLGIFGWNLGFFRISGDFFWDFWDFSKKFAHIEFNELKWTFFIDFDGFLIDSLLI